MVIIKSKLTGKFLKQHSGSANEFASNKRWQVRDDKKFMATLPPWRDSAYSPYYEYMCGKTSQEHSKAVNREVHNRMYCAEALEARRYATASSALTSIGKWNGGNLSVEGRKARNIKDEHYVLPEHLEIHEIVAGNLCLVNPDDDEETKRRKEKDCK